MNNTIDMAISKISNLDEIYIASHVNPDGDNIGSMLAMGLGLKQLGKKVNIIKTDDIPSDYLFLPSIDMIQPYDLEKDNSIDLLITLDCADADRLGEYKSLVDTAKTVINIDHHISNTNFGDINIVDGKASATGEMVYELLKEMDVEINKDISTCLYTAISTDSGSFMFDSVSPKTHEIIANLLKSGIIHSEINIKLYQSRSIEKSKLFLNIYSTLKTFKDNKIATMKVTQDMLKDANAKMEDVEGVISFAREIETVEVACLLKEIDENDIKLSLRSKRHVDVSKICSSFNGGGHVRAAGCSMSQNIDDAEKLIVEQIINMW